MNKYIFLYPHSFRKRLTWLRNPFWNADWRMISSMKGLHLADRTRLICPDVLSWIRATKQLRSRMERPGSMVLSGGSWEARTLWARGSPCQMFTRHTPDTGERLAYTCILSCMDGVYMNEIQLLQTYYWIFSSLLITTIVWKGRLPQFFCC